MKKIILILTLLVIGNLVQAECQCNNQTKCIDLMTSMYNERATMYNVLNLSSDQQKCKDVIDTKRYKELNSQFQQYEQEKFVLNKMNENQASSKALKKQKKVVNELETSMKKIDQKYDNEFKSVLNSEQRSKLRAIRKMQKKEIKHCQKNEAFYKQDPNLRPFGVKMYGVDDQKLCPTHKKWHIFGLKHKNN
jgi:Spy/CpxP family protein refolding chaperone